MYSSDNLIWQKMNISILFTSAFNVRNFNQTCLPIKQFCTYISVKITCISSFPISVSPYHHVLSNTAFMKLLFFDIY